MQSMSTRRFEMGLPLFSGLDLGVILQAQVEMQEGKLEGLSTFIQSMGKTGETRTLRKLAAIWKATDLELETAEADLRIMTKLEEMAAARPFAEVFADAMAFQSALWESLGVSVDGSSETDADPKAPKKAKKPKPTASPSGE